MVVINIISIVLHDKDDERVVDFPCGTGGTGAVPITGAEEIGQSKK